MSDGTIGGESALVSGIASMMRTLAAGGEPDRVFDDAIRILGSAAKVDRVYIFQLEPDSDPMDPLASQRFEWVADGISAEIANDALQRVHLYPLFEGLFRMIQQDLPYRQIVKDCEPALRDYFTAQDIQSILVLPIRVDHRLWGFIGLDDCRSPREWTPATVRMLEAAAVAIGGALERWSVETALREANRSLKDQTRELQRSQRVALSLMEDARSAQQKLAQASAAKSAFLAVMSHEMRTPLNGIMGFAELLLENPKPGEVVEFASTIRESGQVLLKLISDILDFSKIESGHLRLNMIPLSLRHLVRSVINNVSKTALEKTLEVRSDIAPSVPEWILADDLRLRQILLNLVGNAVKFTDHGTVTVTVKSKAISETIHRIHFEIADTGVGISDDAISHIFDPFDQADSTVHRRFGGSGLGLAISRRLCHLMNGEISVASKPGEGSTFSFSIDCKIASSQPEPTIRSEGSGIPFIATELPLRILIVDDLATNRRLACRLLERMGYAPEAAVCGEEAVEMTQQSDFDLILMDVLMPGIDGCEATERIREITGATRTRPYILGLSADALQENQDRCREAGMDGFLTKPIRIVELVRAVQSAFQAAK